MDSGSVVSMWLLLITSVLYVQADNSCNGRAHFPHPEFCDQYYDCTSGQPEQKICPDGLMYNPNASQIYGVCQYPIGVDCTGRTGLQPANATEECPRKNGFFLTSSTKACHLYINCINGEPYHFQCGEGLAFNPATYICDWPDKVKECDVEGYLNFKCPNNSNSNFPSPDCSKYIACTDGQPRLMSCPYGHGFNTVTQRCDAATACSGSSVGNAIRPPNPGSTIMPLLNIQGYKKPI